jgi:hypothetical protein
MIEADEFPGTGASPNSASEGMTAKNEETLGDTFKDLEPQINAVCRMTKIAIEIEMIRRDCIETGWKKESLGLTAVEQLQRSIEEFRKTYYERYHQARSTPTAQGAES